MVEKLSKDDYSAPCSSLVEKINEVVDEVNNANKVSEISVFGLHERLSSFKKRIEMLESRLMREITNICGTDTNRQAYETQEAICNKKAIEQCAHRAVCPRYEITLMYDRPFSVCKRVVTVECSDYLPVSRVS